MSTKSKAAIADLPSGVSVLKTDNGMGGEYWRVRLGKRFTGGAIIKKNFATVAAARIWIFGPDVQKVKASPGGEGGILKLVEEAASSARALTAKQLDAAADAFRRLEPLGLTLTEAIDLALKHARPPKGEITFADAFAGMKAKPLSGSPLAATTASNYRTSVEGLAEEFPKKKPHEITRGDIEDFLDEEDWSPVTRASNLRNLRVFFSWCRKEGYAGIDPTEGIVVPTEDEEPVALTVAQVENLLAAARTEKKMLPGIVLGVFAGLRTSEIRRLTWEEIGDKEIEIKPSKTKTRQRRMVTVSDTLAAWLALCRQTSGPIAPAAWRSGFESVIRGAGYRVRKPVPGEPAKPKWPRNAMRHTFGSYFWAQQKNETLTAAEMGNSPAMVFQHYRRVFPVGEVEKFWKLRPPRGPR